MLKVLRHKVLPIVAFLVGVLLLLALSKQHPLRAGLEFQSELPPPRPPTNPHFVSSASGGTIYCGLQQSSVWLDVPSGFTSEGGAEIHCDPTGSLSQWVGTSGAWDDRGYLIGFWPTETPIVKPLILTFEIDPARAGGICSSCFAARYYDAGSGQWQGLPATYDTDNLRVHVQIAEFLSASGYPGYADRFLIALFVPPEATPTSTPIPTPTPTFTLAPTFPPSPTSTLSPTPTLSPSPTSAVTSPTVFPTVTATPTSGVSSGSSQPSTVTTLRVLVVFLGIVVLVLLVAVILMIRRQRSS